MRRIIDGKNIQFLEDMSEVMKYNSSTNTFEIGTDLYVNGAIKSSDTIMLYNDTQLTFYADKENSADITISPLFGYTESVTQLSFTYTLPDGAEAYSAYLDLDKSSNILTDKNTKTLFGNSLYGTGNIDLYKHYLHIKGGASGAGLYDFYIVIQSSSNVDCSSTSGATKKLRNLLKVSPATPRMYETGVCGPVKMPEETENYSAERPCALYWDGSSLYVRNGVADFEIALIEDVVQPL